MRTSEDIEIHASNDGGGLSVMLRFEISSPIERVFDYVVDPMTVPEWQHDALSQRPLTPGPLGAGTRLTNRKRFLGVRFTAESSITRMDRPTAFSFRSDGRYGYAFDYAFTHDGQRTRVDVDARFPRPRGPAALIPRSILSRAITSEIRSNHLALKRRLEDASGRRASH